MSWKVWDAKKDRGVLSSTAAFAGPLSSFVWLSQFVFLEISVGSLSFAITPCNPSPCLTPLLFAYFLGKYLMLMSATLSIICSVFLFLKFKNQKKNGKDMGEKFNDGKLCACYILHLGALMI